MLIAKLDEFNNKINELINSKKEVDVLVVAEEIQNIYDNCVSEFLLVTFSKISLPRSGKVLFNVSLNDISTSYVEYSRNIIINNVKIPIIFRSLIFDNERSHAIIPNCIIPYSQIILDDAIKLLEFELNPNEDSSSPSSLVEPYADKMVNLFVSYFNDYRSSFNLTADKTVVDLLKMLIDNTFEFIMDFFDKCKKIFLVNRRMLVDKNDVGKKVTAIYLSRLLI